MQTSYQLQNWHSIAIALGSMFVLLIPFIFFIKKLISLTIYNIFKKNNKYIRLLQQNKIDYYLLHAFVSIYFILWNKLLPDLHSYNDVFINIRNIFIKIYSSMICIILLNKIIDLINKLYLDQISFKHIPMGLYSQILKVIISICIIIIAISNLLAISLNAFFTSLGAVAAFLTFIFKDSLLGLLASLQLTIQDIIRIGDWIQVPQYHIEGKVEDINITTVKIKNFDNTLSTIPTSTLINTSIKNWRGMLDSKLRRIKRSIIIDLRSIVFCSKELLVNITNDIPNIKNVVENSETSYHVTNIALYREYIKIYLNNNNNIDCNSSPVIVRELQPIPSGLPLEIYAFVKEIEFNKFEDIQSDIFDHIICIAKSFQLTITCQNYLINKS